MAIEVFNRYETKYLLDLKTYLAFEKEIQEKVVLDKFNINNQFYTICNIYYDSWDDNLIRTSLEKPTYKEKIRLRSYGVPNAEQKVFLEIKKKYNGIVNKRRCLLKINEAEKLIQNHIYPSLKEYMNEQVLNEIYYFVNNYDVMPKAYIAYDRKAYAGIEDKDLRITFDTNIRTRRYNLALEKGDYGRQLLESGKYLMEIKCSQAMPLWLTNLLSKHKIYKTSFSKYGTEYKQYLQITEELKYA